MNTSTENDHHSRSPDADETYNAYTDFAPGADMGFGGARTGWDQYWLGEASLEYDLLHNGCNLGGDGVNIHSIINDYIEQTDYSGGCDIDTGHTGK